MRTAALMIREAAATPYTTTGVPPESGNGPLDCASGAAVGARAAIAADPDALEVLADEIVVLSAHIHAATHRLLVLIVQFDRLRGWEPAGHRTCAHWLASRTGIDLGAAREKVRAARALERLPLTGEAMARGELSFSQVRALTRVAQPESERDLLQLARGATTAQLERMIRAWKRCSRQDEAERERERIDSRSFSIFADDDGMYVVRGRLTPEVGALLMRAVEAAGDALFRPEHDCAGTLAEQERGSTGAAVSDDGRAIAQLRANAHASGDGPAAAQFRADAVALIAELALAKGFDDGLSGGRAERYQVVLHVDAATLSESGEPGRSELEDGTRVSAETSRRLACDAGVVRATRGEAGAVLDVGRRTRTIPPALRRALEIRDRGCRFPACGSRFTDAHHVRHWADGGETSLSNCLLLCSHHHRLVHEGGWRAEWWGDTPIFQDARGNAHCDGGWRPPSLGPEPVQELIAQHCRLGIAPNPTQLGARWRREADIPVELYFRACEAL